jgi:ATP-dependent helicase/nuclease subunit B
MANLNLYIGAVGPYYYFKKNIIEYFEIDDPNGFIYLLPVNRSVRYLKKQLLVSLPGSVLVDTQIFTYSSLIQHIFSRLPYTKKVMPTHLRVIFLEHLLTENLTNFQFFGSQFPFKKGLINKINQMLTEFGQFGYAPEKFIDPPEYASEKYADFSLILGKLYELYDQRLIDDVAIASEVLSALDEATFRKIFPKVNHIFMNGYGIYPPPMLKFINRLKAWCDIDIKLDYSPENEELYRHTFNAFESLSMMANKVIEVNSINDTLSQCLFNTSQFPKKKLILKDKCYIQEVPNRIQEVSYIAGQIRDFFLNKKIPLHNIGVTFPDLEKYAPLIHSTFKEYKIPYNLSTGYVLSHSPLIRSFLQVLKVVLSNYERKEVYSLLVTPFVNLESSFDLELLNRTALKLRITHFQNDWQTNLIRKNRTKNSYDVPEEKLILTKEYLAQFLNILNRLKKKQTASDLLKTYVDILAQTGMLRWFDLNEEVLTIGEKEREFRAFNKFFKLLDQLIWILDFIYGSQKINLSDFYAHLSLIVNNATYNLREWSNFGVQIMPRLEIQSAECRILFIGGLIEGDFPRRLTSNIFFNDNDRKKMGLNTNEELNDQDRFLFYQLISSNIESVIFSYPAYAGETNLLPSTFLTNLEEVSDIERGTEEISDQLLVSERKFKEYIAGKIKTGLNSNEKKLFHRWQLETDRDSIDLWLESISVQYDKHNHSSVSEFEGNLNKNKEIPKILELNHGNKPKSVTALETYAFCPMQYFFRRIVGLEDEEEFEELITAMERGSLIHTIFFRFYNELKIRKQNRTPWLYSELLLLIAKEEFDKMPYQGLLWTLTKEEYFGTKNHPGLLEAFLQEEENEIEGSGFIPTYFEVAFGRGGDRNNADKISTSEPLLIKQNDRNISLYGRIDRIDIDSEGNFIVIDYKSGSGSEKISLKNIQETTSLQLPIYTWAAQKILDIAGQKHYPIAGIYYNLKNAESCQRKFLFINNKKMVKFYKVKPNMRNTIDISQMIDKTILSVFDYVNSILSGNYRHTKNPEDQRCARYCNYSRICRKDIGKLLALYKDDV